MSELRGVSSASTTERLVELSYGLSQRLADNGTGYADVIFNQPTGTPGMDDWGQC